MKFLIINGPNLNMLGIREPEIYGAQDFQALQRFIYDCCLEEKIEPVLFQSNHEGAIVDRIQAAYRPGGGSASVQCRQPGKLSSDLLSGHGLHQNLCRTRL